MLLFKLLFGSDDTDKKENSKKKGKYDDDDELDWELDDMEYFESHR